MIHLKTPRQAVYGSFREKPGACPRCSGELVNKYQSHAVTTPRGKRAADTFIIGGKFGWFCKSCPTVVLNRDEIAKMFSVQKSGLMEN